MIYCINCDELVDHTNHKCHHPPVILPVFTWSNSSEDDECCEETLD